jgi:acyl-homoserine-lactone acylase
MKKLAILVISAVLIVPASSAVAQSADAARWERQAQNVTIIRDDWGIAHVYGKTDADAVFGMIYAQAEDDFNRIESNYLTSLGRRAEAEGEAMIFNDLRAKIYVNPDTMRAMFARSPEWLKTLMVAWADGLNFYLLKNPTVKPRVITRFEPWMALSFSEGSIGGDIERISIPRLRAFYGGTPAASSGDAESREPRAESHDDLEPRGSNGIAIAPANTVRKNSLLLINPHTSFYFRSELQMVSEEGLNAYGAATWGQFFIYQGFSDKAGWMHTSSSVDNIDEFAETIIKKGNTTFYKHGDQERPVVTQSITVPFKTATGMDKRTFTVYRTHHGPVVREQDGKWIAVALMDIPVQALMQSYGRTKAKNMQEFIKILDTHSNSSNNTLFADNSGNVAYFHANYIPRRDPKFDWSRPVDGSDPATDYKGVHTVDESPNVINPASGWVYNTNNYPWSAAGPSSPKKEDFPPYADVGSENARGVHAIRVLRDRKDFTLDGLLAAAFDSYLTAFEPQIPALIASYDATPSGTPLKTKVAEQVELFRRWDLRWGVSSVATTLAIAWYDEMGRAVPPAAQRGNVSAADWMARNASHEQRLQALSAASDTLAARYGKWQTMWGDINRFQRLTADIVPKFDDNLPSTPVMFTSATYGSLASFGARMYPNTKKLYGSSGNSFVAVVEFGKDSVRARAVTAGGESGNPASKHFNDQASRYATGNFRTVYFYRNQLAGHIEREYRPGQ